MLGGGADVLIVPLLLVFGISSNIKTAIGTSLAALLPPNRKNIYQSFYIALCFTIASYYSSKFAVKESKHILKRIYAIFLIIIGIISFKY
jgi:uncharacterized membrane protein YfcA